MCRAAQLLSGDLLPRGIGEELTAPAGTDQGVDLMEKVFWDDHMGALCLFAHRVLCCVHRYVTIIAHFRCLSRETTLSSSEGRESPCHASGSTAPTSGDAGYARAMVL